MSKPTIEEMREALVEDEICYIRDLVYGRGGDGELFNYVKKTCGFKDDEDCEIEAIYMERYGDMFDD